MPATHSRQHPSQYSTSQQRNPYDSLVGYSRTFFISLSLLALIGINACAVSQSEANTEAQQPKMSDKRPPTAIVSQNFAWPFMSADALPVRGGSTQGAEVTLALNASEHWQKLQNSQLTGKQRDRLAILALQGTFRTSFQFTEVAGFYADYTPSRPYFSWGTEYVHVLQESEDFISLQHTLVMFFASSDGGASQPMVMKHWRQDWQYQHELHFDYKGKNTWVKHVSVDHPREGYWTQSVYQVDDSPRYQAVGRWQHQPQFSSWQSDNFTRPLPRREFSVRNDYEIMQGTHSITLTPTGWIHQQNNQKLQQQSQKIIAQEMGLNRYQRIIDPALEAAAEQYWYDTGRYWQAVRAAWLAIMNSEDAFQLRRKVDNNFLFAKHFSQADAFATSTDIDVDELNRFVLATIEPYIIRAAPIDNSENKLE